MQTAAIGYRVADFLKQHPPFQCMDESDLLGLVSRGRVKFHEIDEFLCWQDATFAPFLFVIQQGSVSLWNQEGNQEGSQELLRDIRGPGDVIGIERFAGANLYPYSAKANSDVVVYALPAADFAPLLEKYPPAARYVEGQTHAGAVYREPDRHGVHETYVTELARHPEPLWCPPETTVAEAARLLRAAGEEYLAVMRDCDLQGVVSTAGLLDWIAGGGSPAHPVKDLMSPAPPAVAPGTMVSECVLAMSRASAPVAALTADGSRHGGLLRLVSAAGLQPAFGDNPLAILLDIARAQDLEVLRVLHPRARAFLQLHLKEPASVDWLAQLSFRFNTALAQRLVELAANANPAWNWCFFGAGGREELLTSITPEVAVLCADAADVPRARQALDRLRTDLAECGYLPGAASEYEKDLLCADAATWRERFAEWIANPILSEMYTARPLFDLRPAFGGSELWRQLDTSVSEAMAAEPSFLKLLANDCLSALPPLTFFEDAVVDMDGERSLVFELAHRALVPLVEVGRVFGVAQGRALGLSTLERLELARSRMPAHESVFRQASEILGVLLYLQARTGLRLQTDGGKVAPAQLSRFDRQALKGGFRAIHALLDFTMRQFWERVA